MFVRQAYSFYKPQKRLVPSNLTNNGTYTVGTGTVNMNGSMPQSIGGTSITFYNLTISGTGTVDLGYNTTVSNTLSISSGTPDVTTNNYSVTVDNVILGN